jgi:formate-dependent nitrite reductase membrane component NrfD
MESYEWMVDYTPQTTWIEGHGIFIWLAEVFGTLGGGLYLVALCFGSAWGLFIGWLMVVAIKGGLHLAHLGQPSRFWRLVLRPGSSWLARGLVFVALFGLFGGLQLIASYWLPGTGWEILFKILAGILALLTAAYSGFVMNYVNGIPFWNSALLPLLFITFGIIGGSALIMLIGLFGQDGALIAALGFAPLLLVAAIFLIALYLWTATYMGPAAKRSVTELIQGRLALPFWVGVVLCGGVIPGAAIVYVFLAAYAPGSLTAVIAAGMLVAVFSFNYCLLKGGVYRPLTPTAL